MKYDATTVALRVLRLVAVASIFAFVLTARTVMPTHANTVDPATDPSPADVDLSPTGLGAEPPDAPPPDPAPVEVEPPPEDPVEQAPPNPPATDTPGTVLPPTDPPVAAEPPPADTVEPAPTDPPPTDTVEAVEPPPVGEEPPPEGPVEPAPTDPPPTDTPGGVLLPTDPPVAAETPPADAVEPALTDPAGSDPTVSPVPDRATIADPAHSDPSAADPAPPVPSTHRSSEPVPPVADDPAQTATAPVTAIVSTLAKPTDGGSGGPAQPLALHSAVAAGAGLAAGLVVTNQAPSTVAVAIEFGRAGGGWAGAIVFNVWLRRQMRMRRISQRQLAALAGIDHSTISRLLREDRRPSLTTATKLAGALRKVPGEQAEPETADYFERNPEETVFPARRVELALRADELLDEEQVRHLMNIYLDTRRRHQAVGTSPSAPTRAGPAGAAPDPRR